MGRILLKKYRKFLKKFTLIFRRNPKKVGLILTIAGLFLTFSPKSNKENQSFNRSLKDLNCSNGEPSKVISHVCTLFRGKRITGNNCDDICHKNNIVFRKCLSNKDGKYAVLVDCVNSCDRGKTVSAVLKMKHINSSDIDVFLQRIDDQINQLFSFVRVYNSEARLLDQLAKEDSIVTALLRQLDSEYGFPHEGEVNLYSFLWGVNSKDIHANSMEDAISILLVRTLWSLMDQGEYRISTAFRQLKLFPKIFGFCGPLYLSEYAPFDPRFDRRVSGSGQIPWREKVSKAMHILKSIQVAGSLPHPVHFCDVKPPHFGTAAGGTVRFIDADTVFTNKTLNRDLGSPHCLEHHDCSFFDCAGWCFLDQGVCAPVRTNNNLQVICDKILRNEKSTIYEGLLSNPPQATAGELQSLLNSCADDIVEYNVDGIPMKTPGQNIIQKLQDVLIKSLELEADVK